MNLEFIDLKDCGIRSYFSPSRTSQLNVVAQRNNRMLLVIIQSIMTQDMLLINFYDYALEITSNILSLLLTKKDIKTISKMWNEKPPSLLELKI